MSMAPQFSCRYCRFFEYFGYPGNEPLSGECRYGPPIFAPGLQWGMWPTVSDSAWCGKYERCSEDREADT